MLARQTSVLSPLAGAMQLTGSARGSLIVFGMKKAEGVLPSLPARNERGESWREGKLMKHGLFSPTLSSFFGEEREERIAAAVQANYLPNSIGDSPVPVGDPPTGTALSYVAKRTFSLPRTVVSVPSGGSPDGTGGSPVLPANYLPNTPS